MIHWTDYEVGNHRTACPGCSRKAGDKTLGITIEIDGKGVAHCFRCNYVETHRPDVGTIYRPGKAGVKAPAPAKHETLSEYGREIWSACRPLSGIALQYLQARRCAIPPSYGDLRWHPALKHPSGHVGPALVGLITDVHTQEPLSLHRTWITATGKANIDTPRLLLRDHSIRNGVIRLWPDDEVNASLGIGEGIETCLSLAHVFWPVWATIDAGHLAKFPLLKGISTLVIAQDNDLAGIAAATACAARWAADGRDVRVTQQSTNDLNDAITEEKCHE